MTSRRSSSPIVEPSARKSRSSWYTLRCFRLLKVKVGCVVYFTASTYVTSLRRPHPSFASSGSNGGARRRRIFEKFTIHALASSRAGVLVLSRPPHKLAPDDVRPSSTCDVVDVPFAFIQRKHHHMVRRKQLPRSQSRGYFSAKLLWYSIFRGSTPPSSSCS